MPVKLSSSEPISALTLRQQKIQARNRLSRTTLHLHSERMCLRIMRSREFKCAQYIGAYFAQNGEISLAPLIREAHKLGKLVYVPVILPNFNLRFARFTPSTSLAKNRYGIAEPKRKQYRPIAQLDLLLCPLVAFDKHGHRMGMGGGFYDRALASVQNKRSVTIWGVAHDLQRCEKLPVMPWDIPMHRIITEKRIYNADFRT